jgi:hypothetical protein
MEDVSTLRVVNDCIESESRLSRLGDHHVLLDWLQVELKHLATNLANIY